MYFTSLFMISTIQKYNATFYTYLYMISIQFWQSSDRSFSFWKMQQRLLQSFFGKLYRIFKGVKGLKNAILKEIWNFYFSSDFDVFFAFDSYNGRFQYVNRFSLSFTIFELIDSRTEQEGWQLCLYIYTQFLTAVLIFFLGGEAFEILVFIHVLQYIIYVFVFDIKKLKTYLHVDAK